jgi:hypothetical protein
VVWESAQTGRLKLAACPARLFRLRPISSWLPETRAGDPGAAALLVVPRSSFSYYHRAHLPTKLAHPQLTHKICSPASHSLLPGLLLAREVKKKNNKGESEGRIDSELPAVSL